jgi:serine/threonine-protein kinase
VIEEARVIDFGVAHIHGAAHVRTAEGSFLGTPQYAAPEMVWGRGADARSDQFALAVVLFEMLAGRPPFQGATLAQLLFQIAYQPAPPLERSADVPRAVAAAVARALAKDPAARFASVMEFARALEAAPGPRSRWLLLVLPWLFLLGAGVAALSWPSGPRPQVLPAAGEAAPGPVRGPPARSIPRALPAPRPAPGRAPPRPAAAPAGPPEAPPRDIDRLDPQRGLDPTAGGAGSSPGPPPPTPARRAPPTPR